MIKKIKTSVIIPAGGAGTRFGGDIPKQFVELEGIPLLVRTLMNFDLPELIADIAIAVDSAWVDFLKEWLMDFKTAQNIHFVIGGEQRQDSVFNALKHPAMGQSDIVLIHDAVRPFINEQFISKIIDLADEFGAVIPATTPKETIKFSYDGELVDNTPDRDKLFCVQTPQGFRTEIIKQAYENFMESGMPVTDDASFVEYSGVPVVITHGLEENIKITTPLDFELAKLLIRRKPQ